MFLVVVKEKLVNVRLKLQTHDDFKVACDLRGASMSSLLHQFIVRTIREEKDLAPHAFKSELSANAFFTSPQDTETKRLTKEEISGTPLAPHSKTKIPIIQSNNDEEKNKQAA